MLVTDRAQALGNSAPRMIQPRRGGTDCAAPSGLNRILPQMTQGLRPGLSCPAPSGLKSGKDRATGLYAGTRATWLYTGARTLDSCFRLGLMPSRSPSFAAAAPPPANP